MPKPQNLECGNRCSCKMSAEFHLPSLSKPCLGPRISHKCDTISKDLGKPHGQAQTCLDVHHAPRYKPASSNSKGHVQKHTDKDHHLHRHHHHHHHHHHCHHHCHHCIGQMPSPSVRLRVATFSVTTLPVGGVTRQ